MKSRDRERGDTIIEVLFAMTILGIVVTITISLMNGGFANLMSSMDRTNVQAIMNGQAALLRASRDKALEGDATGWNKIKNTAVLPAGGYAHSTPLAVGGVSGCVPAAKRFYFEPTAAKAWEPVDRSTSPTKRVGSYPTPGDGMWIEAYRFTPTSGRAYYDFYIKSCWTGYGSKVDQEAKVVVRLYEI